jgi:tetratricopeptide (TPR) repeat protein
LRCSIWCSARGGAEATINLASSLYGLLQNASKPRLLERVEQVRDAAAASLGEAWNHARFEATRIRIHQQLVGQLPEALEGAQALLQRARWAGEQAYPDADYDLAAACWLLAHVLQTAGGSEQALPLLIDARQRFEAVSKARANKAAEGMVVTCFSTQGLCLLNLGRLDEAAAAYEESIRRGEKLGDKRGVALGENQLGAVRMMQRRYPEALAAFKQSRDRFTALVEPGSVASIWHHIGMVYHAAGRTEAAEDAYRKSLAMKVQLENVGGQASTLSQLGVLYFEAPNGGEDAASFFSQAAEKFAETSNACQEGVARSNLSEALRKLCRLEEARQEIRRAIKCKAQFGHASYPWASWSILASIETDAGNRSAALEAHGKSIACYLAYRRDGGENHSFSGRISLAVTQHLLTGDPTEAATLLQQQYPDFEAEGFGGFIRALQAIVNGSRDRSLAEAPELDHTMAAEILLLVETLEARDK